MEILVLKSLVFHCGLELLPVAASLYQDFVFQTKVLLFLVAGVFFSISFLALCAIGAVRACYGSAFTMLQLVK